MGHSYITPVAVCVLSAVAALLATESMVAADCALTGALVSLTGFSWLQAASVPTVKARARAKERVIMIAKGKLVGKERLLPAVFPGVGPRANAEKLPTKVTALGL
jgi:hypothetical protein